MDDAKQEKHLGDIGGDTIDSYKRTLVIPAYNEEMRIGTTLKEYLGHFDRDTEIVIVLNGCHDRTGDIACSFLDSNPNLRIIDERGVVGKGGAVTRGFRRAKGDIVAYVDADGATSAAEIERLMDEICDADGVIGSRWIDKDVIIKKQSLFRRLASRVFNAIVRVLFGLPYKDTQCGAKVFKREAVHEVVGKLGTTNLAFDVDLLYLMKKHGFVLREVPTTWEDKDGSKICMLRAAPRMLGAVIRMRIKHSRFSDLMK
ncbi:MAG: glycosyltransferase [Actinobacteria bacterium]|nr:glycosyltransferase [Actinomycetota bacterium]